MKKDADRIGQLIEKTKPPEYEQQHVQLIRLELIRRIQGIRAAEKLLKNTWPIPTSAQSYRAGAFARRWDYATALRFAEDGAEIVSG